MTHPLSATTFVHIVDESTPYFGCLAQSFSPLLPYNPDNSHPISLLKMPVFSEDKSHRSIQVRRSQATKQPYVFEVESEEGSVCFYRACLPSFDLEFGTFRILSGAGNIKLEVDSSNALNSDFDILYFTEEKKELVLAQVDLSSRELRTKRIPVPPELVELD